MELPSKCTYGWRCLRSRSLGTTVQQNWWPHGASFFPRPTQLTPVLGTMPSCELDFLCQGCAPCRMPGSPPELGQRQTSSWRNSALSQRGWKWQPLTRLDHEPFPRCVLSLRVSSPVCFLETLKEHMVEMREKGSRATLCP